MLLVSTHKFQEHIPLTLGACESREPSVVPILFEFYYCARS